MYRLDIPEYPFISSTCTHTHKLLLGTGSDGFGQDWNSASALTRL